MMYGGCRIADVGYSLKAEKRAADRLSSRNCLYVFGCGAAKAARMASATWLDV
jgi:hypothetical protein